MRTDVAIGRIDWSLSSSSPINSTSSAYSDSRGRHAALIGGLGRSRTARRCTRASARVRVIRTPDSESPWNAPDRLMNTVLYSK